MRKVISVFPKIVIGVLLTLCIFTGTAFGAYAVGNTANATIGGRSYFWFSDISTGGIVSASSIVAGTSHSVPVGWTGVNARLFSGGGAMMNISGATYNTWEVPRSTTWGISANYPITSGYSYYSQGEIFIWNGTGYISGTTPRTPNLSA